MGLFGKLAAAPCAIASQGDAHRQSANSKVRVDFMMNPPL